MPPQQARDLFVASDAHRQLFTDLLAEGRGIILVTGHYGNWRLAAPDWLALQLPLTVVAMTEANPEVNRARREIREALGVETLEVRQSLGNCACSCAVSLPRTGSSPCSSIATSDAIACP